MANIVNITITEVSSDFYKVTASYKDECGKEYNAEFSGEIFPWDDIYVPVYKALAFRVICKALRHKEDYTVRVQYPDVNDKYDGFQAGITEEYECKAFFSKDVM